ncbi:hypothetical protein CHARACLAT_000737 [Characodon lateralis]|uniref:Uncharacterized protein n=1 Tax=Characodon lateralis TaxID=208331 RepID=A0ABU7D5X2_9TELE|nr:hypothetical protein [Characodon lateralis]
MLGDRSTCPSCSGEVAAVDKQHYGDEAEKENGRENTRSQLPRTSKPLPSTCRPSLVQLAEPATLVIVFAGVYAGRYFRGKASLSHNSPPYLSRHHRSPP